MILNSAWTVGAATTAVAKPATLAILGLAILGLGLAVLVRRGGKKPRGRFLAA